DSRINTTMNIVTPITLEGTLEWFRSIKGNPTRVDLVLTHNDVPVAMSGVSNLENGNVESYTFVDPEKKGQGLGSMAQFLRLAYVFDVFGAERVHSIVDVDNIASRKAVEKFVFLLHETKPNHLEKNGQKIDRCYYSCIPNTF